MKRLRLSIFVLLIAVLTACTVTPAPTRDPSGIATQVTSPIFINELHYDNESTDTGEAVEIAGPAGTDLSGWSIALYNGSSTQLNVYDTISLAGTLPDLANGYGTLAFARAGIQNGSPDGLALVDASGGVVQFLSYEGSFTAASGPAAGMTSTDIGVAESSSTAVGFSLQLAGTGSTYEDFSWSGPSEASFGQVNAGQVFDGDGNGGGGDTGSTTLVINEIDYDQAGTDTAEFIELKNVSEDATDLDAYTLVLVNGSGASVYNTIDLPAVSLAAGDYFVVCANAATVTNCDLDASTDNTNFIQNGAPDAVALMLGEAVVDTVSYEGDTAAPFTEGSGSGLVDDPSIDDASISRYPDGVDSDLNNVDLSQRCATPGAENLAASSDCAPVVPPTAYFINDIQGSGEVSPLLGALVIVEAVVTGDFQYNDESDNGDLGGFYIQEEADDTDSDPLTSEGVFVYDPSLAPERVSVGDLVRFTATVAEYETSGGSSSMTQLTSVQDLSVLGSEALPAPVTLELPLTSQDELERVEGMLVQFAQDLVISEYFNYDRFGEIILGLPLPETEERIYQPTSYLEPGAEAAEVAAEVPLHTILLDDGRSSQNPDVMRHPDGDLFTLTNRFRGGDVLQGVVGVIDETFGTYRVQPTAGATYIEENPRPAAPDEVGGSLTVASFNVLNYFLTLDNGPDSCGPGQTMECRGADTAEELERQRAKILAALEVIGADIFGLIEIENTSGVTAEADLVAGLGGTYAYIDTGTIGTDAIKVALLYDAATVTPVGDYAILDSSVDPRFDDSRNRPALAQTFEEIATGARFTVVVNHLKSKGSGCGSPDDDPLQGNCNGTRTRAAEALVDWLATDPTGSGDPDVLIVGDLNAYDEEDPIAAILAGADDQVNTTDDYTDLLERFEGEFAYTYLFSAQLGYLDYALAACPLVPQVTGTTAWHINADEPDLLDYDTSFKSDTQDALYAADPYRASDHDPVIVGLELFAAPEDFLNALRAAVEGLNGLNRGQSRALMRHLDNIERSVLRGNADAALDQTNGLEDQITDFVNEGILSVQQGNALLCLIQGLRAAIA